MKVSTDEIQVLVRTLCDYLDQSGRSELFLEGDYYWEIDSEQLQMLDNEPADFSMGQLTENWSDLQKIASGDNPPIGYAFVWLGHILTSLGHQNPA